MSFVGDIHFCLYMELIKFHMHLAITAERIISDAAQQQPIQGQRCMVDINIIPNNMPLWDP